MQVKYLIIQLADRYNDGNKLRFFFLTSVSLKTALASWTLLITSNAIQ